MLRIENFFRRLLGLTTKGYLMVGSTQLTVEIADTAKSWEQGLSGHAPLKVGQGMLFTFPRPHMPTFWMKDVDFPIDIIWIKDGVVIDITPDVPAQDGPDLPTYSPIDMINMVLETPAGYSKSHDLQVGDIVSLHN